MRARRPAREALVAGPPFPEIVRNADDKGGSGAKYSARSAILRSALEGRILAGRYRLISQLGRGGMGSVWRAEHIDLGTPAAVKLIDETFAQSPEALTRFRREAQAAASLRSANVVQILDYGVDGETPFIAMELLEGVSLADQIERHGRMDPEYCVSVLLQVSKALTRAHEQGIVHRDLKPDNIFLTPDGDDVVAKVLDFGIAKRTGALQTSSDMATRTGSLMGTPYYMSPEQASGRRQVDQRTDIWAFAVIAYEALTGGRPFDDSNLGGLLLSICTENPQPASRLAPLPPAFDEWFARCTVKDPAGRFDNIREAAAALCQAFGILMPTSRFNAGSQGAGRVPAASAGMGLMQSGAGAGTWKDSRGASVATPGAVVMPVSGMDSVAMAQALKRRPPMVLIASGAVATLGLLAVVGAMVFRNGGGVAEPATSGIPGNPASALPTAPPTATSSPLTVTPAAASVVPAVAASANAQDANVAASVTTSSSANAPVPPARRRVAPRPAQRQDMRQLPGRQEPDEPPPQRYRPQDRLERDLGF